MNQDRELLEMAAKAAGINLIRSRLDDPLQRDMLVSNSARNCHHENGPWNPLTDDGDALRLAVALHLVVHPMKHLEMTQVHGSGELACEIWKDSSPASATRRAIVRAAAAIGKAMP